MNTSKAILLVFCLAILCTASHAAETNSSAEDDVTPKVKAVAFQPARPATGDRLKAQITLGGGAVRAEAKWTVNGEDAGLVDLNEFDKFAALGKDITAGDKIAVAVTPFDSVGDYGDTVTKQVVCGNAPPVVKVLPDQRIEGNTSIAEVEAFDPEGTKITLKLQQSPPGMTLDQDGKIRWKFGKKTKGRFPVKIVAEDENGAKAILSFSFAIKR
jgi:hypothetical protein